MTTYKTEAEAWQAVADVLQSGSMPLYNPWNPVETAICIGLCPITDCMLLEGHITHDVRSAMRARIYNRLQDPRYRGRGLPKFDEWGVVGRRLKIAQTFARRAAA